MFHQRYIQKVFQPRRMPSGRGSLLALKSRFLNGGVGGIKADGPQK